MIIDAILEAADRNSVDARAAVTAVRVSPPRSTSKRVGVGQLTAGHGVLAAGGAVLSGVLGMGPPES